MLYSLGFFLFIKDTFSEIEDPNSFKSSKLNKKKIINPNNKKV